MSFFFIEEEREYYQGLFFPMYSMNYISDRREKVIFEEFWLDEVMAI